MGSADAYDFSKGMKRSFTKFSTNDEWWVVWEPARYKGGNIKIKAWISHYQTPEAEKEYSLKLEEADRLEAIAKIEDKKKDEAQKALDDAKKNANETATEILEKEKELNKTIEEKLNKTKEAEKETERIEKELKEKEEALKNQTIPANN